ncbi:MAG TPA: DUF3368 domain-containing protein [Cytophagales bacterium]|nr:DUF3368 domain-containing protein [Cytophagales bacterium]HAA21532.1 DUF3368 domain-containing protein [Cytophagales bacterium]HAP64060.1 DUF3368 domain-containing protein [Cytophagales bacterium]
MSSLIVSDTSVLVGLLAIDHFSLLKQLYGHVIIPSAVKEEMQSLAHYGYPLYRLEESWIEVLAPQDEEAIQSMDLDLGEAQAIQLALELEAGLLLIDERKGRALAKALGIRITGIVGILLEAKTMGLVEAIKPLIGQLENKINFRLSEKLIQRVLEKAGE